ncbi:mechanosensitive ion channel family protein [Martelella mediterranea]|uniref:Small-conductance mechanosensitive channel n=1 Tax=Martelella mediterranea TaxID=293089 RepID=A0A4V6P099_9HYPH|nr:mechanosensitive ion channel domain-containing protein [Martelella mediterranea]TCT38809.1 small-conductance mechanosensitive channel [Martelella mediterranea]
MNLAQPGSKAPLNLFRFLLLFSFLLALAAGSAFAQSSGGRDQASSESASFTTQPVRDSFVTNTAKQIADYQKRIRDIENQLEGKSNDDATLSDLQTKADQLASDISQAEADVQKKLEGVRAELTELGSAPGPGEPAEPAVTTDERNHLLAMRSEINALSDHIKKLATASDDLAARITTVRREQFTQALFKHTNIRDLLSTDFRTLLAQEADSFSASYGSWLSFVLQSKRVEFILANVLSVFAAFFFYQTSSRLVARTEIDFEDDEPDYVARLLAAFFKTVLPIVVLIGFLLVSFILFTSMNILLPDVERFVREVYISIVIVVFVFLLSRNVLAPRRPKWRLIPIGNNAARHLTFAFTAIAAVNWADQSIAVLNDTLDVDFRLEVMRSLVVAILIGALLVAVSFIHPRRGEGVSETGLSRRERLAKVMFPSFIAVAARLVGLFVVFAAIIGYVALARFVAMQIVLTGAVLITIYIGILVGRAVGQPGSLARTRNGRRFVERYSLTPVRADQISLLAGLAIYAITLAIGIPLTLMSWGVRAEQIRFWASNNLTSISIGSISISLGGILIGILLFIGAFLVTRWFERWFDENVLLRSRADAGVRNSVKTGIKYLGIVIAVLLAVSAAGVNLSSLALVASALSIGIGFGLQTIVSNFVSGLILLVERPFKVGDWIVSGTTEGFVKRISVRATEIETFQRQSIIVPNSELINASVGNWMHHNQMGRSEVAVGVSYDSEPRRVMDILMEIATSHPLVLQNPEPMVIFMGFGESTLDFEVRVYLADVFNGIAVRNDIRVAIFERFRDEGITIPYPQRDLHIIPQKERRDELADAIRKNRKPGEKNGQSEPQAVIKPVFDEPGAGNDDGGDR